MLTFVVGVTAAAVLFFSGSFAAKNFNTDCNASTVPGPNMSFAYVQCLHASLVEAEASLGECNANLDESESTASETVSACNASLHATARNLSNCLNSERSSSSTNDDMLFTIIAVALGGTVFLLCVVVVVMAVCCKRKSESEPSSDSTEIEAVWSNDDEHGAEAPESVHADAVERAQEVVQKDLIAYRNGQVHTEHAVPRIITLHIQLSVHLADET
jgi:hypothetical protein